MFIQSKAATSNAHKNGLALEQRRGGRETLIQWSNGDQQWCVTQDLEFVGNNITLIGGSEYTNNGQKEEYNKDKGKKDLWLYMV